MSKLLESLPLGTILNLCVPNDDKETHQMLCCLYLNDYILSVYKPTVIDEQQVKTQSCVNSAIYVLVMCDTQ